MTHTLTDFSFGYAHGMSTEHAFYELLQNLMDGVVQSNGGTFNMVRIEKSLVVDAEEVQVVEFFNGEKRLAQIVQTPSNITFSNFDIVLENIAPLTKIGCTTKRNRLHQAGQHGEGFKRATLRLLLELCHVRVICALKDEKWVDLEFDLNQEHDCMSYSCQETKEAPRPSLNITVSWAKPEWKPPILLDTWLITVSAVVRDPTDANDVGTLLNGPTYNGKLYHWHLFIKEIPSMRFGYDCFMGEVARDRHILQLDQVLHYVAAIISRSILQEDNVGAELFYEEILCKDTEAKTMESKCLKLLSVEARKKLLQMFTRKSGGRRFIRQQETFRAFPQMCAKHILSKPDHVVDMFESVSTTFIEHGRDHVKRFLSLKRFSASPQLQHVFAGGCTVMFLNTTVPVLYYAMEATTTLPVLVFNYTEAYWKSKGMTVLVLHIIPDLVRNSKLKIPNAVQFMQRLMEYFGHGKAKEPKPKRLKRAPPPPGYAYYEGPPLLVKIEK